MLPEFRQLHLSKNPFPMPLPFVLSAILLLAFAAWRDVATRTIPDGVSLALAVSGLTLRGLEGWEALVTSLAVAAVLFLVLFICHMRGAIGGGDVKLLTALALGLPPIGSFQLLFATALAGGVLAVLYLGLRHLLPALGIAPARPASSAAALRRIAVAEARRIHRRGPLPYGVAIAIGGALVLLQSPGG